MTIQPAVRTETRKIAVGVLVLSVLMVAVFLILRRFDYTVLLGALLGSLAAVGNFFLMALSVQRAADSMPRLPVPEKEAEATDDEDAPGMPLSEEAKRAGNRVRVSYALRLVLIAGIALLAVKLPCFHPVAALLPLLFPQIVIALLALMQKRQKEA